MKLLHAVGPGSWFGLATEAVLYLSARLLAASRCQQHTDAHADTDTNEQRDSGVQARVIFPPQHVAGTADALGGGIICIASPAANIVDAFGKSIPQRIQQIKSRTQQHVGKNVFFSQPHGSIPPLIILQPMEMHK